MFKKVVFFVYLSVNTLNSFPQQRRVRLPSSYLAPIAPPQDQDTSPSKTVITSFEPVASTLGHYQMRSHLLPPSTLWPLMEMRS